MAEATGISIRRITNVGEMTLYELKATATDGETITIPSSETQITASTKVQLVSVNNVTDGTVVTDSCTYDDGNRRFTYNETGASDEEVRILFYASDN